MSADWCGYPVPLMLPGWLIVGFDAQDGGTA